jgi:hypothetical protein
MEGVEAVDEPPDYLGVHYYGADGGAAIRYLEMMQDPPFS